MASADNHIMDGENEKYTLFFTGESPFSQWYMGDFTVDGYTYNCAEQYMMHQKAGKFRFKVAIFRSGSRDIAQNQIIMGWPGGPWGRAHRVKSRSPKKF